jgi:hypothetical protein
MNSSASQTKLNLKAGELVEVRSRDEVLATLDANGCHESTPFMPEMLQFCGQKFRVSKRADKTCDPAHEPWSIRRVRDTVHLEDLRCAGQEHGGCQAGCLIFWKEAWLKRAKNDVVAAEALQHRNDGAKPPAAFCTIEQLLAASKSTNPQGETVYACQATTIRNYTSPMASWDPRQYIRDLSSGNLSTGLGDGSLGNRLLELTLAMMKLTRALLISLFNLVPRRIKGAAFPFVVGKLDKTPTETLNLQAGEVVQVRTKEEIIATLDKQNRNRGMLFDGEMLPYCGGIYRVLRRVDHILDEKSGKMVYMKSPCIILEGAVCQSDYHRLCPRAIYPYWRENWLKRAPNLSDSQIEKRPVETCELAAKDHPALC